MYLAHYTKRFIPEFDAECRLQTSANKSAVGKILAAIKLGISKVEMKLKDEEMMYV